MTEEWRPIPGQEDRYEVSSLGRVRSLDRRGRDGRTLPGEYLTPVVLRKGYQDVRFTDVHGHQHREYVHRLVALTFLGPAPKNAPWVLHGPAGVDDNSVGNLRWGTAKDNWSDRIPDGTWSPATHCKRGHEFTPANTKPSKVGARVCRECVNQRNREYRSREKLRSATPGRP